MMPPAARGYNEDVNGVWGRGAAIALIVSSCFFLLASVARADESYPVGPSPIVRVLMSTGKLTVQTWDNPEVSISTSGTLDVQHLAPNDPRALPPPDIVIDAQTFQSAQGMIALARENFVLPRLPAGPHDAIVVRGQGDTTITIPRDTAFVFAHVRAGRITISNYSGVFVAHTRMGGIDLQRVSGTGFVQSLRGTVTAENSSFARLRARTGLGDMLFRGCTSNQIEASSTYGSIVYDNGQFQPGLARFESQYGNVALGVQNQSGGVQIGAHSGSGRIVSNYNDGTQVSGSTNDTEALVRGGGPVVTTSSQNGSVYLYNGAMSAHPLVQQNLEPAVGGTAQSAAQRSAIAAPRIQAPNYYPGAAAAAKRFQASGQQAPRAIMAPRAILAPRYRPAPPPPQAQPRRYPQRTPTPPHPKHPPNPHRF